MPDRYFCPALDAYVELNDERRQHILDGNVDGNEVLERLPAVVAAPDVMWRERSGPSILLAKWFDFP